MAPRRSLASALHGGGVAPSPLPAAAGVAIVVTTTIPSIRNDESAHAVGYPEAPTPASNPRHHLQSAYHASSLSL
ncbi:hypothetical protein Y032_0340g2976 [Ancylostoma ceylanicum]|uniref:Uncharacterized protein n=1 Tax=Ancylostoma ceylanicum TaxID=53326 RepID=A0A016RXS7_9BILA|nr:hypothetical protein Y032_0340g2976 [Ancylostoma ceylanicum]